MKDSLQEISVWLEQGGEFVREQAPLVVQEILTWASVLHGTNAGVAALAAFFAGLLLLMAKAKLDSLGKDDHEGRENVFCWVVVYFVTFTISFTYSAIHVGTLLYVVIAPRLYVIDEVKRLLLY